MFVSDLGVAEKFRDMLSLCGVSELYPPQALAVDAGILEGKNILLCTPTASGKTIAAELAIIRALESGGRAVYVVPLRALAYEKWGEFQKYARLGYNVRLEVGDLDSSKYGGRGDFDILIATAEKCDSILRSRPSWFEGTKALILDEIHLISSGRGPVYEVLTVKFTTSYPGVQVIGLSATVGNAAELALWLRAQTVVSDWRPVRLEEKVCVKSEDGLSELVSKTLKDGQTLVFVNSRKSAEAVAEKLSKELHLKKDNISLADEVSSALNPPTKQCRRLASCVLGGSAFHHAGLVNEQRVAVEDAFKRGDVDVIVATPTLSAGVNLPSRTVVLRDVKRYGERGLSYIEVFEYKQLVGRAGRPKYDRLGTAITLAKDEGEADYIVEHYINGFPEDLMSRLGVEPVLRFHILALVASGFSSTRRMLSDFFAMTFFGHQYGVGSNLENLIDSTVDELVDWGFLSSLGERIKPTPVGERVSQLYIDPLTAHNYLTLFKAMQDKGLYTDLGVLEVLSDATEMPKLNVSHREEAGLWGQAYEAQAQMVRDLSGFDLDYEFLNRFKTANMLMEWISESTEEEILESYNVAPGQLNQMMQNLNWLCYSAAELTRISKMKNIHLKVKRMEARVKYGVLEELLQLVSVKGVGRVRARKLHNSGIKNPTQIKAMPFEQLSKIVGKKTAEKIKKEIRQ
jgi:helicase